MFLSGLSVLLSAGKVIKAQFHSDSDKFHCQGSI